MNKITLLLLFLLPILSCGSSLYQNEGNPPNKLVPPSNLTAISYDGKIMLTWAPSSGALSYALYWSNSEGVNRRQIWDVQSPYLHTGLTNGVTYYYVVTALDNYGESADSLVSSATPS